MSDAKREMTLGEVVGLLPEGHRAKRELKALREAASRLAEGTREELSPGPTVRDVESVYGVSAAERPAQTWQPMLEWTQREREHAEHEMNRWPESDIEARRPYFARVQAFSEVIRNIERLRDGMPLPAAPRSVVAPEKE